MKAAQAKIVTDPYEWMPSDGEDEVNVRQEGLDVILTVGYEDEKGKEIKKLIFKNSCAFYKASFPGLNLLKIEHERYELSGCLIEFTESEAAVAWRKYWRDSSRIDREIKHYKILFLEANEQFEIFAESFVLGGSEQINERT